MSGVNAPPARWNHSARAVLVDALSRLPARGCVVEMRPEEITVAVRRTGPGERTALAACGAVLSAARVVLTVLGTRSRAAFPHDPARPDVVAALAVRGPVVATDRDWARYVALRRIGGLVRGLPVRPEVLEALVRENDWPGTRVVPIGPAPGRRYGSRLVVITDGDTADERILAGAATHTLRLAAAVHGYPSTLLTRSAGLGTPGGVAQAVVLLADPAGGSR